MRLKVSASKQGGESLVMLKYVSKLTMDILPSVVATIIGAYIVNHYIVAKPDAPVAAAVSPADPKQADAKPTDVPSDVANIPPAGVRAKGIKAIFERSADKAVEKQAEKPVEKSADKPTETASIPADTHRNAPPPHEKTAVAKISVTPASPPVQSAAPAVVPVVAAPVPVPPVEAAVATEPHRDARDANDLARAAIERLRGSGEAPHAQEAIRVPEPSRSPDPARMVSVPVATAPQQVSVPARPLPPPIMVSTPSGEAFDSTTGSVPQRSYPSSARIDDPRRPTPPADIPNSGPYDLRAETTDPATPHTTVADDMLSAAKSVFHAVLPK
jgi:hypothetical protein